MMISQVLRALIPVAFADSRSGWLFLFCFENQFILLWVRLQWACPFFNENPKDPKFWIFHLLLPCSPKLIQRTMSLSPAPPLELSPHTPFLRLWPWTWRLSSDSLPVASLLEDPPTGSHGTRVDSFSSVLRVLLVSGPWGFPGLSHNLIYTFKGRVIACVSSCLE